MRDFEAPDSAPRRRKPFLGCLLSCVTLPVLLFGGLYYAYVRNNHPIKLVIPSHSVPAVNGLDDFIKAGKLAQQMPHKFAISMPMPKTAFVNPTAASKDAAPVLAQMRLGFTKPCVNSPVRSAFTPSPQFAAIRELARTVSGEADYQASLGHIDRAVNTRLDGYEMGVMLPNGGTLMADLVGIACEAISLNGLEVLLPKLTEQELAQVAAHLDRIAAKRSVYAEIVLEDAYCDAASQIELINNPKLSGYNDFDQMMRMARSLNPETEEAQVKEELKAGWYASRFLLANKEAIVQENLEYGKTVAQETRQLYTKRLRTPRPKNVLAELLDGVDNWMMGWQKHVAMETVTQLLRTEVALYHYKAARGRFPDQLALLTPVYLKSVPDDPFGGAARRPLRYKSLKNGKDFLLYSLGANLQDDGGLPQKYLGDAGVGDMVARQLWRKRVVKAPTPNIGD